MINRQRGDFRRHARRRRSGFAQHAFPVNVLDRRVEDLLSGAVSHADNRQLVLKRDELLYDQLRAAERSPRGIDRRLFSKHALTLAVVSQAPRLQNGWQSYLLDGRAKIWQRIYGKKRRRRNFQLAEKSLFEQAILGDLERFERRKDLHPFRDEFDRGQWYALELIGGDIDAVQESLERAPVGVVSGNQFTDLADWSARIRIEKFELDAQLVTGDRQHPPQLTTAEYSDFHSEAGSG